MHPAPDAVPLIVLLGNYPPDRQQSMLRFRDLVQGGLAADGFEVASIFPECRVGPASGKGPGAKWLGYVDKYLLFPLRFGSLLAALKARHPDRKLIVHICDHSNAVYTGLAQKHAPVVVTCHDLLAVRGALGEDTDCPASGLGRKLQMAILAGLKKANQIVCVSQATRADLIRLGGPELAGRATVLPLAQNYSYGPMTESDATAALRQAGLDLPYRGYILHVGSDLRRKNREALLLSAAQIKETWPGLIVFAGDPLTAEERAQAAALGLADRVREIQRPANATLHALYAAAHAFLFLSRAEGFGWPILEAQICGCPVICSNRTSVPEVAGDRALIHEPDAYADIAADIQRLQDATFRDKVSELGRANAASYTVERMMRGYEDIYRRLA
jgi:glycosyltransferase involved in cell wall biosynthesis